jgi:hypothetical protein
MTATAECTMLFVTEELEYEFENWDGASIRMLLPMSKRDYFQEIQYFFEPKYVRDLKSRKIEFLGQVLVRTLQDVKIYDQKFKEMLVSYQSIYGITQTHIDQYHWKMARFDDLWLDQVFPNLRLIKQAADFLEVSLFPNQHSRFRSKDYQEMKFIRDDHCKRLSIAFRKFHLMYFFNHSIKQPRN